MEYLELIYRILKKKDGTFVFESGTAEYGEDFNSDGCFADNFFDIFFGFESWYHHNMTALFAL